MTIETLRQNIHSFRTLDSHTESEAVLRAKIKEYEDQLGGADDLKQAELLAQWTSSIAALQRARSPSPEACLALINRYYVRANGQISAALLGGPEPDPQAPQSGINPLELSLGVAACLLGAAGPQGVAALAVITALSQIYGIGGSDIDWDWVFSRIRSIVREELRDVHVEILGNRVKSLGDWMVSSLAVHPEWRPDSGQFQSKLMEVQELAGELMYAQGSNATQAGALAFFVVAANFHVTLLVAAADACKRDGKTAEAKAHLNELVGYLSRYVPHARRLSYFMIAERLRSIDSVYIPGWGGGGVWGSRYNDRGEIMTSLSNASLNLYIRLVRLYMRAAMASTLDTAEAWMGIVDKARAGEIIAGVRADVVLPSAAPDLSAPVQLFVHCDFQGGKMELFPGRYDYASIAAKIGNDEISSVKVRPGYRAVLYTDDFSGSVYELVGNARSLPGFNDNTSSVIVERVWQTPDPVMIEVGNTLVNWVSAEQPFALLCRKSGLAITQRPADVAINQQPWTWGARQKWRFKRNADGTYRIENIDSGQALGLAGASKNPLTNLVAGPSTDAPHQRWNVIHVGLARFRFENVHSGLCVDVRGGVMEAGGEVLQWAWYGGASQCWRIVALLDSAPAEPGPQWIGI